MERPKRQKDKKIRVNITIDESVFLEIGNYVDNLSGYINSILKKFISNRKELEKDKKITDEIGSHKDLLSKKTPNSSIRLTKDEIEAFNHQAAEEGFKWW